MVVGKSENQTSAVGRMLSNLLPQGPIVGPEELKKFTDLSIADAGFSRNRPNNRHQGHIAKDPIYRPLQNTDAFSPSFKRLLTEPGLLSGRKRVK